MKRTLLFLGIILLALTSCKKNKVEIPESNDPVFRADGTFGSNTFSIIAGDDDVYMHTMTMLEQNVEVVSGKIANNEFGIEIGIYNGFIDQPNHQFENDFNLSPIFAKKNQTPLIVLHKSYFSNASEIQTINWTIGNNQFQGSAPIYEPGKYMVCAEITFTDNSIKNLCNELIIGYNRNETGKIETDFMQTTGALTAYLDQVNSSITAIQWFIDGNYFSSSDTLTSVLSPTSHEIKAKIQYSNGVYREKTMVLDAYNSSHTIEDFTFFESIVSGIIPQDYNIRIKLHQDGVVYESTLANNNNSTVLITDLNYYGKNPNGFDVYKINATVNCKVKENGGSAEIPLQFTTIFGIEIK